ncbi:hypothetical protein HaLaN_01408, partial [Haematococcus lacustris]
MLLVAHLGTPCTVYRAGAPGTKLYNIFRRKAAHICRASNASQPAHSYGVSPLATSRPPSSPKEVRPALRQKMHIHRHQHRNKMIRMSFGTLLMEQTCPGSRSNGAMCGWHHEMRPSCVIRACAWCSDTEE